MNFTPDELRTIKNLVAKSGLIRAFDGQQWIDLRIVMQNVIDDTLDLHSRAEKSEYELFEAKETIDRLTKTGVYHDGP